MQSHGFTEDGALRCSSEPQEDVDEDLFVLNMEYNRRLCEARLSMVDAGPAPLALPPFVTPPTMSICTFNVNGLECDNFLARVLTVLTSLKLFKTD